MDLQRADCSSAVRRPDRASRRAEAAPRQAVARRRLPTEQFRRRRQAPNDERSWTSGDLFTIPLVDETCGARRFIPMEINESIVAVRGPAWLAAAAAATVRAWAQPRLGGRGRSDAGDDR